MVLKSECNLPTKIVLFALLKALLKDENAFHFILKALFVLKIFKFLCWRFGQAEKTAWFER